MIINRNGKQAGKRLYTHNELDHEQLFEYVSHIQGDFLMTYDNEEEVRNLARRYGLDTRLVSMKNTHHETMTELLIGRNLNWATLPQPMPDPTAEEVDAQLQALALYNPSAAIIQAWLLVEKAGGTVLAHLRPAQNGQRWPRKMSKAAIRLLHEQNYANDDLFTTLMKLVEIRNKVMHALEKADPTLVTTRQDALEYLELAKETVRILSTLYKTENASSHSYALDQTIVKYDA